MTRIAISQLKKRSKYGVDTSKLGKRTRTMDGILFASKAEADRYQELRLLQQAGEISNLEPHPSLPMSLNGVALGSYTADFLYKKRTGALTHTIVEDVKGQRTGTPYALFKLKKALMLALYKITVYEVRMPRRRR